MIADLRRSGKTVVLTTHNTNDVDQLCDRVSFMVAGRFAALDAPETLKAKYGRRTIRITHGDDGIETDEFPLDGLADNSQFHAILKAGAVRTLHSQEASLDQVFSDITGTSRDLAEEAAWAPQATWFLAGALVFGPLLVAALAGAWAALPAPSLVTILNHLRVRRMTPADWRLTGYVFLFIGGATAALYVVNASVWPRLPPHPPFLTASALEPAHYYILLLWVPFFAVNIIGEELWWRGFIQPRQEPVFGRFTWIIQGVLHAGFHFSFGLGLVLILLPTVFALPWAVQRSKNTSVGILLHAAINGPAFLAINLGLMPT